MNPRAVAARLIAQVINQHRSLTQLFEKLPPDQTEIGLIKALCFGVTRWYFTLSTELKKFLSKPLKDKDADVHALLLVGLYQIFYLQTKDYIAVMETVAATRDLKKPWASGLVNAVLRNCLRAQLSQSSVSTENSEMYTYSHPQWLIDAIKTAWPTEYSTILTANNQHPPLCLRVNTQRITMRDYLALLQNENIIASTVPHAPCALIIETTKDITQLPGYQEGYFSVQDSAAQLVVEFLAVNPKQHILDACAAPGGKTLHILEKQPDISTLIAVDVDAKRLKKAQENQQRLKLPNTIQWVVQDVCQIANWWDQKPFDRILLDAPCSATGVIRRHPDIKLLRKFEDIPNLASQQTRLLETLWPLLAPSGLLLYTTCSILPIENEMVILDFLGKHADAKEKKLPSISSTSPRVGIQILPGFNNMDGFYYACLQKI